MAAGAQGRPIVVGANHRSSTVGLRERMFLDEAKTSLLLTKLAEEGIAQAIVLSTCDRVEVQSVVDNPVPHARTVRALLTEASGEPSDVVANQLYDQLTNQNIDIAFETYDLFVRICVKGNAFSD